MKKSLLIVTVCAALVLVGCTKSTNTPGTATDGTTPTADSNPAMAALAQCLTSNGVKMYGTEWCPHCQNQKALFGADFDKVTYIDCDEQKQVCMDQGIQGYPTWKDTAGNFFPGVQSLEKLAEIAGCSMDGTSVAAPTPAEEVAGEVADEAMPAEDDNADAEEAEGEEPTQE